MSTLNSLSGRGRTSMLAPSDAVEACCRAAENLGAFSLGEVCGEFLGDGEPVEIVSGYIQNRPVAAPHQPLRSPHVDQRGDIGTKVIDGPARRSLGREAGKLAVHDWEIAGDRRHLCAPWLDLAPRDVRLGAVIDDKGLLGITAEECRNVR